MTWLSAALGFVIGALVSPIAIVVAIRFVVGVKDNERDGDR